MVYTCAYFPTRDVSLEAAQTAKLDLVCRKLQLKPGERVVEAGCGWGALALHMARKFGVKVRAFNISKSQLTFARERAANEGLDDLVEFVEADYREIEGRYDVFVSVGMLEHVGQRHYRELGQVIDRCLPPDGRGLIHSIGTDRPGRLNSWIERRIFPGAQPPSLGEMMPLFGPAGFSVLDVENLRLHYALTLRHWRERFIKSQDRVLEMFDQQFVRAWLFYLASSETAFSSGHLQLFQVLFARKGCNAIPWTRASLYRDGAF
jgi:cyclopropane-fatty-acyl-phospholipid synthase